MAFNLFFYGTPNSPEPTVGKEDSFYIMVTSAIDTSSLGRPEHHDAHDVLKQRSLSYANTLRELGATFSNQQHKGNPVFQAQYLGNKEVIIPSPFVKDDTAQMTLSWFIVNGTLVAATITDGENSLGRPIKRANLLVENAPGTWNKYFAEFPRPKTNN